MNAPLPDKLRVFLVSWLFTPIYGMTMDEWLRLLRRHQFAVDPPYLPRAAFMTAASAMNSALAWYERRTYDARIRDVPIQPPVFILGHWRSGTTLLHNMLSQDEQFAYARLWQAVNPHIFLTTERFGQIVRSFVPNTRLTDNVSYTADSPLEDQFATTGSLSSQFLRWAFPRDADLYDRYLTFRDVPEEDIERWKSALLHFYRKLTWKYNRPLLLKSPPHTCRIKLFLDMFPDARFIHVYRNPYAVFQSSRREVDIISRVTRLQKPIEFDADAWIIQRYKTMYDAFFEEQVLIPPGQLHEVRFEDLTRDPVGQVQLIYEKLHLKGFDTFLPTLQRYLASQTSYTKNSYPELPLPLRRAIGHAWRRNFELWGYPYDGLWSRAA